jgi:hypothetical protein
MGVSCKTASGWYRDDLLNLMSALIIGKKTFIASASNNNSAGVPLNLVMADINESSFVMLPSERVGDTDGAGHAATIRAAGLSPWFTLSARAKLKAICAPTLCPYKAKGARLS